MCEVQSHPLSFLCPKSNFDSAFSVNRKSFSKCTVRKFQITEWKYKYQTRTRRPPLLFHVSEIGVQLSYSSDGQDPNRASETFLGKSLTLQTTLQPQSDQLELEEGISRCLQNMTYDWILRNCSDPPVLRVLYITMGTIFSKYKI